MHEIEETDRLTEPEKNLKGKRIENVNFSLTACLSPFRRRETVYGAAPFKCLSPLRGMALRFTGGRQNPLSESDLS